VTRQEQVFIISTQRRMNWLSHYVTRRWCDEARARGPGVVRGLQRRRRASVCSVESARGSALWMRREKAPWEKRAHVHCY